MIQVPSPHVVHLTNAWNSSSRRTQHVLPRMAHALIHAHTNFKMIKWIFLKIKLCMPLIPIHASCVCVHVYRYTHTAEGGVGKHPWSRIYPIYPLLNFLCKQTWKTYLGGRTTNGCTLEEGTEGIAQLACFFKETQLILLTGMSKPGREILW